MSIKIAITSFFLLALASSACYNSSEAEGKCTNCTSVEVLINGNCFAKIRGCLRYSMGPVCVECQNGYILTKLNCIRQAQFFNNTNLTFIPPVVITPNPTLTIEDIRTKLGQLYGPYASEAHQFFVRKYSELSKAKVKFISRLDTKKGSFLAIEYELENLIKYQAVANVTTLGQIRQWSFQLLSATKSDPVTANNLIRNALTDKLKDYIVYQFKQEGDIFIFDYMGPKFQVTRVIVSRNDLNSPTLINNLRVKTMTLSDLGQQLALQKFPFLQNLKVSSVQKYEDYYVLYYGPIVSISFKFSNYNFLINNPYQTVPNPPTTQTGADGLVGGFAVFTNYSDSRFTASVDYLARQFPEIVGAQIVRVQSQVVAGVVFLINLKKSIQNSTLVDQYEFRIAYSLDKVSVIMEGKKNGKIIASADYNYNLDPAFFSNYKILETQTKVANIPPIKTIEYKNLGNKKYYKIIYSAQEYSEFEYLNDTNKVNVLSYTVDGENIILALATIKPLAEKRSNETLLNFIQANEPAANPAKIKQVIYNLPLYTLILVTSTGTYSVVIDDKGGELVKAEFTKISDVTCFTLSTTQAQTSDQVNAIDSYLKLNYPISDYKLQLVQISVKPTKTSYRLVYSNAKLMQIEIYLDEANSTASVIKASYLNYGYSVLETDLANSDYREVTTYIKNSDLGGEKIPFFIESNQSLIKAYVDDTKSIIEVYYDPATKKATTQTIYTRSYLLVPEGFSLETLVLPGGVGLIAPENVTISKISQEISKKYTIVIKDAVIVYVDRKNSTYYLLMFKSSYGYLKIEAVLDTAGKITINRLIITGYTDSDFSNCMQFSTAGKCLTCNRQTEIQFQGACFKKLQGCIIQAANICVKCNVDYVKSASKCVKDCSAFFK